MRQRTIEQKDQEQQNKHRNLNTFINSTTQFMQFLDKRIIEENKDSFAASFINSNQTYHNDHELLSFENEQQLPKHMVHKHESLIENFNSENQ